MSLFFPAKKLPSASWASRQDWNYLLVSNSGQHAKIDLGRSSLSLLRLSLSLRLVGYYLLIVGLQTSFGSPIKWSGPTKSPSICSHWPLLAKAINRLEEASTCELYMVILSQYCEQRVPCTFVTFVNECILAIVSLTIPTSSWFLLAFSSPTPLTTSFWRTSNRETPCGIPLLGRLLFACPEGDCSVFVIGISCLFRLLSSRVELFFLRDLVGATNHGL